MLRDSVLPSPRPGFATLALWGEGIVPSAPSSPAGTECATMPGVAPLNSLWNPAPGSGWCTAEWTRLL